MHRLCPDERCSLPKGQSEQLKEVTLIAKDPGRQGEHSIVPFSLAYVPFWQSEQEDVPEEDWALPFGHALQLVAPSSAENIPESHLAQDANPGSLL